MKAAQVLGLWLDDAALPGTRVEAWRTLVAALAGGMSVRLLDVRHLGSGPTPPAPPAPPGVSDLSELPAPEHRLLDALAAAGVPLERASPEELAIALGEARSIVALSAPNRPGTPAVLSVDAAFLAGAPGSLAARLCAAGQIMGGEGAAPGPAP